MNILFVCTGNTCRSPMAAAYLKAKNLPDVTVISRGLAVCESAASANAVAVMREWNMDLAAHKPTALSENDLLKADRIFALSPTHKAHLAGLTDPEKITVLGGGISDPYGGDESVYRNCRNEIATAIDRWIESGAFSPVTVRPASVCDIPGIAALERECFAEPWSETAVSESLNAGTHFIVAEQSGTVVGYLGVSILAGEGYITNVAVTESRRRQQIGTKLLERLMDLCREHHAEFISLEVRSSNQKAIGLYRKFGFETVGERKNFYRLPTENALIMTKRF